MRGPNIFPGGVTSAGKFLPDDRGGLKGRVRSFAGKRIEIVVRAETSQRSLDQNNFWWAFPVRLLAEHCGYTPQQMHYALLGECFGYVNGPTGHPIPNQPSSSALTTAQFSHLIEWVLIWGPSEMGVLIPAPNEASLMESSHEAA